MSTLRLELQVKFPEPLEHNAEVLQVLLLSAAKDDDIIQVNHAVHEIQFPQGILHEVLKVTGALHNPNSMQMNL